jgi:hypothetical protein
MTAVCALMNSANTRFEQHGADAVLLTLELRVDRTQADALQKILFSDTSRTFGSRSIWLADASPVPMSVELPTPVSPQPSEDVPGRGTW